MLKKVNLVSLVFLPPFYVKKSEFSEFGFPKHNAFLFENRFRTKK